MTSYQPDQASPIRHSRRCTHVPLPTTALVLAVVSGFLQRKLDSAEKTRFLSGSNIVQTLLLNGQTELHASQISALTPFPIGATPPSLLQSFVVVVRILFCSGSETDQISSEHTRKVCSKMMRWDG